MAPHVKRQVCHQTICKFPAVYSRRPPTGVLYPQSTQLKTFQLNICQCLRMFADSESFISCRLAPGAGFAGIMLPCRHLSPRHFLSFLLICCSNGSRHFCSDLPWSLLLAADIYLTITRWAKVTRRLALGNTHSWSPKGPETTFPHFWMSADLSCYLSLLVSLCCRWFHPALKITLTRRPEVGFYQTFCAITVPHGRAERKAHSCRKFKFLASSQAVLLCLHKNVALLSTSFSAMQASYIILISDALVLNFCAKVPFKITTGWCASQCTMCAMWGGRLQRGWLSLLASDGYATWTNHIRNLSYMSQLNIGLNPPCSLPLFTTSNRFSMFMTQFSWKLVQN